MPVMDGFTSTSEIKKIIGSETGMQLSIIALTAYTTDNFKTKCINSGMNGFLSKPLNVQQLSQVLDEFQILMWDIANIIIDIFLFLYLKFNV